MHERSRDPVPIKVFLWHDVFVHGSSLKLGVLRVALPTVYLGYPECRAVIVFLLPLSFIIFIWAAVRGAAGQVFRLAALIVRALSTGRLAITASA